MMLPASCGLCHCTERAIAKKPTKPGKDDPGAAQTLLKHNGCAQILRRPVSVVMDASIQRLILMSMLSVDKW
jgi:hypothetical protein